MHLVYFRRFDRQASLVAGGPPKPGKFEENRIPHFAPNFSDTGRQAPLYYCSRSEQSSPWTPWSGQPILSAAHLTLPVRQEQDGVFTACHRIWLPVFTPTTASFWPPPVKSMSCLDAATGPTLYGSARGHGRSLHLLGVTRGRVLISPPPGGLRCSIRQRHAGGRWPTRKPLAPTHPGHAS